MRAGVGVRASEGTSATGPGRIDGVRVDRVGRYAQLEEQALPIVEGGREPTPASVGSRLVERVGELAESYPPLTCPVEVELWEDGGAVDVL
jgi:hypothetical protein